MTLRGVSKETANRNPATQCSSLRPAGPSAQDGGSPCCHAFARCAVAAAPGFRQDGAMNSRRRARFLAPPILALAIFFGCPSTPRGAETVAVAGGISNGSGVLVLDWPAPVIFSARIDGDRLVLKFARPFDAVFAPAVAALGDFLLAGGLYPDRRTAVFALKRRDVVLRSYYEGPRVIVELFPLAPEKISPSARPQAAARPKPAPVPAPKPVPEPARQPALQSAPEPAREAAPPAVLSPVERARVLLAENRPGPALAAVAGESGNDAERLRLDAHWRRGDWKNASAAAMKLCDGLPAVLSDSDRRLVLDAAIAASLARDGKTLASLHSRFGAAMEQGEYRYPFRLLAEADESGAPGARARRLIETAEGVQRFLAAARASTARVP